MYKCLVTAVLFSIIQVTMASEPDSKPFRFHTSSEPTAIDPANLFEASGGYVFNNLYRALYRLSSNDTPELELAETCAWKSPTLLKCLIRENAKFSNGEPILADHFVKAWRRLVDPATRSRHAEILLPIKNARAIIGGKLPATDLSVAALSSREIQIQLDQPDAEFLYRLSLPALTPLFGPPPTKPEDFKDGVFTGPYRIKRWLKKTRIELEPNPHYWRGPDRSPVELLIVEDDNTALNLYDLGKLDFLRRLNVKEMIQRQKNPDFIFQPLLRVDYVGFGHDLNEEPQLRKALIRSLNYGDWSGLLQTPGRAGCPTLPKHLSEPWPCVEMNLGAAKRALKHVQSDRLKRPLTLVFSGGAGEDVARSMEWMQSQWKKNLGIDVELKSQETKVLLDELRRRPPPLFRKGVNLDRPTCMAALELFRSNSPDNFVGLKSAALDDVIAKLGREQNPERRRRLCGKGLTILFAQDRIITLGEMHFAMLARPDFQGWYITSLNQLDLSELRTKDKTSDRPRSR